MLYFLALFGLAVLFVMSFIDEEGDRRRIEEQRPGDVEQLRGNLVSCALRFVIMAAVALMLWIIGMLAA